MVTIRAPHATVQAVKETWARVLSVENEYTNSEIGKAIDEYIHSYRDRMILRRRLIDGILYDELADEFNLSVRHIKRIVYTGQDILFKHLRP